MGLFRNKSDEAQIKLLQKTVTERDVSIRRLTQTLSKTQDLLRQAQRQRDEAQATAAQLRSSTTPTPPRGPAVEDVAIKTASLVKGGDILVGSDGRSFWEIGRVADNVVAPFNPSDLRLVKR
jgi:nucleotide-binding universal stress UspA family protein